MRLLPRRIVTPTLAAATLVAAAAVGTVTPMVAVIAAPGEKAAPGGEKTAAAGFVEHIKAARDARARKDYAASEKALKAALEVRPRHPTALYELAVTHAQQNDADGAIDALDQLAEMGLAIEPSKNDFAPIWDKWGFKLTREQFERNSKKFGEAPLAFELKSPTFIPEGLAYDRERNAYFVGGVHERRIVRVKNGEGKEFIAPGASGLWAPLGMTYDEDRDLLWVASAAIPEMKDAKPEEIGRSGLFAFHPESGEMKGRYILDTPGPHVLGDVVVLPRSGAVYTTDSKGGVLYELDVAKGTFRALTAAGALSSPQGVAASRNEKWLYVADYTQGLFRYEIADGELERVEADREVCLYGIDGLYRYEHDLIAIQNGIRPHRVVRITLERNGRRARESKVLASGLERFDEPTLGAIVGRHLYFVANSQLGKFDSRHQLPPVAQLKKPAVLRLNIEGRREEDHTPRERRPVQQSPSSDPVLPLPGLPVR